MSFSFRCARAWALGLALAGSVGALAGSTSVGNEQTLYAATVRAAPGMSPSDAAGTLYIIDPETAKATTAGPLRLDGAPIGITGLAVHPQAGVFYGVTAGSSINHPRALVTIDPVTGDASLIGDMRVAGSDISFSPDGQLYVYLPGTNQVARINSTTGRVTPLGEIGEAMRIEGGIAFDAQGRLFVTAGGATGTLDQRDPETGAVISGPTIANAPYLSSLNSLAFSPQGELYAVNSNMGNPAHTSLVKIDLGTGLVTTVGPLPEDTDCITFVNTPVPPWYRRHSVGTWVIAGSALAGLLLAFGIAVSRRRARAALVASKAPAER